MLQKVSHFKDIQYTSTMTYGELFLQNEYEMSCYNLDEADVEGQRKRFDLYNQASTGELCRKAMQESCARDLSCLAMESVAVPVL